MRPAPPPMLSLQSPAMSRRSSAPVSLKPLAETQEDEFQGCDQEGDEAMEEVGGDAGGWPQPLVQRRTMNSGLRVK